jgi:hypothetical protein
MQPSDRAADAEVRAQMRTERVLRDGRAVAVTPDHQLTVEVVPAEDGVGLRRNFFR